MKERAQANGADAPADPVLEIADLRVALATTEGLVEAVRGVSLSLPPGACAAVVGESGSGKTLTGQAVVGLLPRGAQVRGSIRLEGRELVGEGRRAFAAVRGARVGMVFQDPMSALAPHLCVGEQVAAPLRTHRRLSRARAWTEAVDWLDRVRIPEPARWARRFPHELSGGMRQRVMIAAALAPGPRLVIADEPTTALDVTVQAEVLDLLDALRAETGAALLLITHDMGVVARMADQVCVMRQGAYVESGPTRRVLLAPEHPYTRALLAAVPRLDAQARGDRPCIRPVDASAAEVLAVSGLGVAYGSPGSLWRRGAAHRAVRDAAFRLRQGETLGVVGESGSGKSTLARAALRLTPADAGVVAFLGRPLPEADRAGLRRARRDLQIVFQDPLGSLDPTMTVGRSLEEPLIVHRRDLTAAARRGLAARWLEDVGLSAAFADRYPHQLSGGQAQRVGIARAMILEPRLVVCDEAVSALDASVRALVLDLLISLQHRHGVAILFISHDLAVVREMSHRVLVLYRGEVVEEGPAEAVLRHPRHAYTRRLLAAVLTPVPAARTLA